MGKKVRLMAGAAGMVPALGLAVAAPAAAAAHASGKKVSLQAGHARGATACTGTFSKSVRAASSHPGSHGVTGMSVSVSYRGSCVLGVAGRLFYDESPASLAGDVMRTRVFDDGVRVFGHKIAFTYSSGSVRASQIVGVIGHKVCATAFSRLHPTVKVAGPICVRI